MSAERAAALGLRPRPWIVASAVVGDDPTMTLAWLAEFPVAPERLNPRSGAIALGHPLGAAAIRRTTTLINHLEQTRGLR